PAKSAHVAVELSPELTIEGVVQYVDGRPVEGVEVSARGTAETAGLASWTTDANGAFRLEGLAEGRYEVAVDAPWGAQVNVRATTVGGVAAGSKDVKVTVEEGGVVRGRVLDEKRRPVADAWITASRTTDEASGPEEWHGCQARADGAFEIVGLGAGAFQ